MVLEKLSESLKNTLSKIARSMFVDEKLIDELVKDIQRALLQADVNVQLVFSLTKEIKRRAMEEKPPGSITQKEYLVKIVYDELTRFLGGEKNEIVVNKKPFKIMFVGLYGSGKCVKGDSVIPLANGEIKTIKSLYEETQFEEIKLSDGHIKRCNIPIYSFEPDTFKVTTKNATTIWKLKKTDPLLEISLDNGNNHKITVTPEHPFFILENGHVIQRRADSLKNEDFVAVPKYLPFEGKDIDIKKILLNSKFNCVINNEELALQLKQSIKAKFGTLEKAHKELSIKQKFPCFSHYLKHGILHMSWLRAAALKGIKLEFSNILAISSKTRKNTKIPLEMSLHLAELLGYIYGDGNIDKNGIHITTQDQEVIDRISQLSKRLFNIKPILCKNRNVWRISICCVSLVHYFNSVFGLPIGKKSKIMSMKPLIALDKKYLTAFISSYFACDGYSENKTRSIEITTASKLFSEELRIILLRYGIFSSISKKITNGEPYYRLFIKADDAEIFAYHFSPIIEYKKERLYSHFITGIGQTDGKQNLIPVGSLIKEVREKYGATIGEIQKYVSSYGIYEQNGQITRESLNKFLKCLPKLKYSWLRILNSIKEKPIYYKELCNILNYSQGFMNGILTRLKEQQLITLERNSPLKVCITEQGRQKISEINNFDADSEQTLRYLAKSNLCWIKVKSLKETNKEDYVYDLTVDETHNFVANGMIVHNTTTISKVAKFYSKRGFKVAAVGLDVHRPAAPEQLQQAMQRVGSPSFIKIGEKNALKIYQDFENDLNKFDVILVDTAGRDALSQDLIEELEKLNNYIRPDERLLVISGDIGQAAQKQAQQFHESCNITGVVITKMDGTAKGGGALSACSVTKAPVKFIGVGEKVDDLEQFNPKGFVGRLLGMGDIEALLEKAQFAIDDSKAEDLGKRIVEGDFNFIDLYEQMEAMQKMGSLQKIIDLIPGMGNMNIPKEMLNVQENKVKKWKFILQSMTKKELEDPELIDANRIERIAKGSGSNPTEVRELLKQYRMSKKMMKVMKGSAGDDVSKLMKKFKGKMPKKMKF